MMDEKPVQPLDYRAPEAHAGASGAGCMSVIVGLFGLPFLIHGIVALAEVRKGIGRFFRSDESGIALFGLPIGLICSYAAIRWWRRRAR
ncbi:MAG TPA: hypothetical protein VGN72_05630 [Tepidisphaeraceae bacterium]|jgi:hypothetical protein|nr:hypothetical protein [Tepidisphaeraceae bacterium]